MSRFRRLLPALVTFDAGLVAMVLLAVWMPDLPDPVATHWTGSSVPDGFTSIAGTFTMFAVVTAVGLLVCVIALVTNLSTVVARVLSGTACGTVVFVLVLMLAAIAPQRVLADAADAAFSWRAIAVGLAAGLIAGFAVGLAVPSEPTGRSYEVIGTVPVGEAPDLPVTWTGRWTKVVGDDGELRFTGAPGFPRIRIPLDRVVRAEVVSVKALGDFGGWGYRVAVGGRLSGVQGFVWQSGPALLVVASDPDDPTSQRREIAAIDDAEAAAGQINALIAR